MPVIRQDQSSIPMTVAAYSLGSIRKITINHGVDVSRGCQTGLSRATICREINAGNFPKQLQLSPQRIGWLQREINDCKSERRRGPLVKMGLQRLKAVQKALSIEDQT